MGLLTKIKKSEPEISSRPAPKPPEKISQPEISQPEKNSAAISPPSAPTHWMEKSLPPPAVCPIPSCQSAIFWISKTDAAKPTADNGEKFTPHCIGCFPPPSRSLVRQGLAVIVTTPEPSKVPRDQWTLAWEPVRFWMPMPKCEIEISDSTAGKVQPPGQTPQTGQPPPPGG